MSRDPRLRERLHPWQGEAVDAVLLGVPCDEGVVLGGGRAGAAEGPAALRRAIQRFGTLYDLERGLDLEALRLADGGDVPVVAGALGRTHEALAEAVARVIASGAVAVVVGGGHDLSFGSVSGLARAAAPVGGVNVDAHLDVREVVDGRVTSGTPFRRVLEELGVPGQAFVELGAHPHVNAREHHEYLARKGAAVWGLGVLRREGVGRVAARELRRLAEGGRSLFVSVDLDVFAAAVGPGVSAPGTDGLDAAEGAELAFAAGADPAVRLFELVELAPRFDVDERTARLAAMLLCEFLSGLTLRRAAVSA